MLKDFIQCTNKIGASACTLSCLLTCVASQKQRHSAARQQARNGGVVRAEEEKKCNEEIEIMLAAAAGWSQNGVRAKSSIY